MNKTAATPKTAYDLMARVAAHILEEPKRYYQGKWVTKKKSDIVDVVGAVPQCGTVACRAGWIVALHDGLNSKAITQEIQRTGGDFPVAWRAHEILDMSDRHTSDLFDGCVLLHMVPSPTPGTAAYAKAGAKGIREFMRTHKAHLQARLLKDVPKP